MGLINEEYPFDVLSTNLDLTWKELFEMIDSNFYKIIGLIGNNTTQVSIEQFDGDSGKKDEYDIQTEITEDTEWLLFRGDKLVARGDQPSENYSIVNQVLHVSPELSDDESLSVVFLRNNTISLYYQTFLDQLQEMKAKLEDDMGIASDLIDGMDNLKDWVSQNYAAKIGSTALPSVYSTVTEAITDIYRLLQEKESIIHEDDLQRIRKIDDWEMATSEQVAEKMEELLPDNLENRLDRLEQSFQDGISQIVAAVNAKAGTSLTSSATPEEIAAVIESL